MVEKKNISENLLLNIFKFISCFLIVGSHCLPLFKHSSELDYFYGQWLFRFCVPLFLISSGYFFFKMNDSKKAKYIKRILILYIISTIIYLPFIFAPYRDTTYRIKSLILGRYHLWYISAMLFGLVILYLYRNKLSKVKTRNIIIFCLTLIFIGAFFDEYYKIFSNPTIKTTGKFITTYLDGGRNFIFFATPMLLIGYLIGRHEKSLNREFWIMLLPIFSLLAFIESCILKELVGDGVSADLTLVNYTPAIALVIIAITFKLKAKINTRFLRKVSDYIYIIHIFVIHILRANYGVLYLNLFFYSFLISFGISIIFMLLLKVCSYIITIFQKKKIKNTI